jgi:hypothetical protein
MSSSARASAVSSCVACSRSAARRVRARSRNDPSLNASVGTGCDLEQGCILRADTERDLATKAVAAGLEIVCAMLVNIARGVLIGSMLACPPFMAASSRGMLACMHAPASSCGFRGSQIAGMRAGPSPSRHARWSIERTIKLACTRSLPASRRLTHRSPSSWPHKRSGRYLRERM